jgi:hypothetical protein
MMVIEPTMVVWFFMRSEEHDGQEERKMGD